MLNFLSRSPRNTPRQPTKRSSKMKQPMQLRRKKDTHRLRLIYFGRGVVALQASCGRDMAAEACAALLAVRALQDDPLMTSWRKQVGSLATRARSSVRATSLISVMRVCTGKAEKVHGCQGVCVKTLPMARISGKQVVLHQNSRGVVSSTQFVTRSDCQCGRTMVLFFRVGHSEMQFLAFCSCFVVLSECRVIRVTEFVRDVATVNVQKVGMSFRVGRHRKERTRTL